jgi:histidinol-phosphate aminotransferase
MSIDEIVTRGLRGLTAYHAPQPRDVRAKLDANELPYPLPPEAVRALATELASVAIHRYPPSDPLELRELCSNDLGVRPESLVFGNGSDELITMLCATFGEPRPGRSRAAVLYPDPSFVVYRIAALGHGLDPVEVPLDSQMELDFERVAMALRDAAPNLAFFALPNNPTGTLWDPDQVAALAAQFPSTLFISDEAYIAYGGRTLVARLAELPNLVVMRTLSKIGMAGLRVGFLTGAPAIVKQLETLRMPYNLGALQQRAAVWMLRNQRDWLLARCRDLIVERERIAKALRALPEITVFPSEANLLLCQIGRAGDHRATALCVALAERGILIRNFDRPGSLAGCVRITPGTAAENDLLLAELPAALASTR